MSMTRSSRQAIPRGTTPALTDQRAGHGSPLSSSYSMFPTLLCQGISFSATGGSCSTSASSRSTRNTKRQAQSNRRHPEDVEMKKAKDAAWLLAEVREHLQRAICCDPARVAGLLVEDSLALFQARK